ncbi:MAG TPA: hypothetical protein VKK30_04970, partial [Actinomycetota bacterium]|nr:hypothetical protein [Actinomycetota bacterium]
EPAIRAGADGTFYGSSENGLGSGTLAWKSVDGGRHYLSLLSPNGLSSSNNTGFAPGGGDTDLAMASAKNEGGSYNVYVASLNLANVDVSTSSDGGRSWTLNATSATIPGDDRPWIAADSSSKVCISYHDAATFNINVDCSYDAGTTFTQHAVPGAIDASHAFLIDNNQIGNLAIDPRSHAIYQTFSGPADLAGTTACGGFTCLNVVWIAVSTDGGHTFTDRKVYQNPDQNVSYGHQFVNVSIDQSGNLYSVYTDNHIVSYSFSTDQAQTWHGPFAVSKAPAATAIFPWSVAGSAGKLDIVYYGTRYYDGQNPPDSYPPSATWYVYMAQNLKALTPGSPFTQVAASPIVHSGGVCEGGISCTGNRDLYDDFGVSASPLTGFASIIYSDDQYTNDGNDPPQPGCTRAKNNSGSCDHTAIATQTSGKGIFG